MGRLVDEVELDLALVVYKLLLDLDHNCLVWSTWEASQANVAAVLLYGSVVFLMHKDQTVVAVAARDEVDSISAVNLERQVLLKGSRPPSG